MPSHSHELAASPQVYTIVNESRYLVVRNLPAVGAQQELLKKFALYAPIEEWRMLDQTDGGDFTDVMWLKFRSVEDAKLARKHLDDSLFYAHPLHITYAPEYETEADTWEKLQRRRMAVSDRLSQIAATGESVPERGKRPRYVERQRTVLKPIDTSVLPFAAPRWNTDADPLVASASSFHTVVPAAAAAAAVPPPPLPAAPPPPPPPPPPKPSPAYGGSFEDSAQAIRAKLQRVVADGAEMPKVQEPKQKRTATKRAPKLQI